MKPFLVVTAIALLLVGCGPVEDPAGTGVPPPTPSPAPMALFDPPTVLQTYSYDPSSPPEPDEPVEENAMYDLTVGMGMEESDALTYWFFQELAWDLEPRLATDLGQCFNGMEILHEPQWGLAVHLVRDCGDGVPAWLADEPVTVVAHQFALAELHDLADEMFEALYAEGVNYHGAIDIVTGTAWAGVPAAEAEQAAIALGVPSDVAAGLDFGDEVMFAPGLSLRVEDVPELRDGPGPSDGA